MPLVPMTCAATVAGDVLLAEFEQRLKPAPLQGVFGEFGLFEAEPGDLFLQVGVLLARVAKVDVVVPVAANAATEKGGDPLEGSDGADDPGAQEQDFSTVRLAGATEVANLHGKQDRLRQQNGDQYQSIPETDKK